MASNDKDILVNNISVIDYRSTHEELKSKEDEKKNETAKTDELVGSLWKSTTLRQKMLLVNIIASDFLTTFCLATPSPFFSRIVQKKGGSLLYSAIILQGSLLSMAFFSVLFGYYQSHIGRKNLYLIGLAISGISQFGFGFINYINDIKVFTATGVILRVFQGVGEAAFVTASTTVSCSEYPKHITKVFGFTEAATGAGYLMGPFFGGALFESNGMLLPMAISGGLVLITIPFSWYLIREYPKNDPEEENTFKVMYWLINPYVVLILCSVATVFGTYSYCDVAMTVYLKEFTTGSVGLVLFVYGIGYSVCAIFIGYIVGDRSWTRKLVMAIGMVGFGGVLFIYTPHQLTSLIYVGSALLGMFGAMANVPGFEDVLIIANNGNPTLQESNLQMYGVVSGGWFASMGIGMFVFPLIGSFIDKGTGSFVLSVTVVYASGLLTALLLFVLLFTIKRLNK